MINHQHIAKNFSRAAREYNEIALVQLEATKQLVDTLIKNHNYSNNFAYKALDLGSGTSFFAKNFLANFPNSDIKIFEIDLALDMLKSWQGRGKDTFPIQAKIEELPFKPAQFDLIFSSFALQWVEDLDATIAQIFSLLKSGGIFALCLPTEKSLNELRNSEIKGFNQLPKFELLQNSLQSNKPKKMLSKQEIVEQNFDNSLEAIKFLKRIGANYSSNCKIINKSLLNDFRLEKSSKDLPFKASWHISYFLLFKE